MKSMKIRLFFLLTAILSFPAAAGHLLVVNKASSHINVKCGHDGGSGQVSGIEHDHSKSIDLHGTGDIHCSAYNESGHIVSTRSFHFPHGDETFTWTVVASHH